MAKIGKVTVVVVKGVVVGGARGVTGVPVRENRKPSIKATTVVMVASTTFTTTSRTSLLATPGGPGSLYLFVDLSILTPNSSAVTDMNSIETLILTSIAPLESTVDTSAETENDHVIRIVDGKETTNFHESLLNPNVNPPAG